MARVALSRPVAQMCPTLRAPPRQTQHANTDATYLGRAHNCRNFIFKRHFPIHKIFERSCEIGLWRLTAHRISEIFGVGSTKGYGESWPRSSIRSSMVITSCALTGRTRFSSSTKNSRASCAMSFAPTIYATLV